MKRWTLKKKRIGNQNGMYGTPEYYVWKNMIKRCTNSSTAGFYNYGGRGILICEKWRNSFLEFFKDMGDRPPGLTLERRNNNGNYEPANCYWASRTIQSQNKRLGKNNKTGILGVYWDARDKIYKSFFQREGERIHLGSSKDFFDVCCLRKSAEAKYKGASA